MSDETQGQPPQDHQPNPPEQPAAPQEPQPQPPGSPPENWQNPPGAAPNPDPHGLGPTSMGMAPTAAAAISYVFGWVTGLIFFLSEKTNKFVRFHAMQSILLSVVLMVLWFVVFMISLFAIGTATQTGGFMFIAISCLSWIVLLGYLVLLVVCIIQAATGKWFKLPIIGDFAAKQAGV